MAVLGTLYPCPRRWCQSTRWLSGAAREIAWGKKVRNEPSGSELACFPARPDLAVFCQTGNQSKAHTAGFPRDQDNTVQIRCRVAYARTAGRPSRLIPEFFPGPPDRLTHHVWTRTQPAMADQLLPRCRGNCPWQNSVSTAGSAPLSALAPTHASDHCGRL